MEDMVHWHDISQTLYTQSLRFPPLLNGRKMFLIHFPHREIYSCLFVLAWVQILQRLKIEDARKDASEKRLESTSQKIRSSSHCLTEARNLLGYYVEQGLL